jgi:hypothetical protein
MTNAPRRLLGVALVVLAAGCKANGGASTADPAPAPVTAAVPSASAAPVPVVSAAPSAHPPRSGGCPTAVQGATATASDTPDGIALTISAKDPAAASDIRDRAHALALLAPNGGGGGAHAGGGGGGDGTGPGPGDGTGQGTVGGGGGGGGMGRCPVLLRSVSVEVKDTKDGAIVTMRPHRPHDLDSIRSQVRTRLAGD